MKKVFFSFAIATMMAALASCGGSSNQNTDSQDSTAVEEEVAAEDVEEEASNLIENEAITATLAERWTASKVGKKSFEFTLYKNPEKETGILAYLNFDNLNMSNLERWHSSWDSCTDKIDQIEIGGITFEIYADNRPNNGKLYIVADAGEKGLYQFETFKNGFDEQPSIKAMLQSVSFK